MKTTCPHCNKEISIRVEKQDDPFRFSPLKLIKKRWKKKKLKNR